jgi:hypothetical protein
MLDGWTADERRAVLAAYEPGKSLRQSARVLLADLKTEFGDDGTAIWLNHALKGTTLRRGAFEGVRDEIGCDLQVWEATDLMVARPKDEMTAGELRALTELFRDG